MTLRTRHFGITGLAAVALGALALLLMPALSAAKHGSDDGNRSKGRENAGTVAAYDSASGELTIDLEAGGTATALVTDKTRIRCVGSKRRGHGDSGHQRRGRSGGAHCGTAALVAGAPVRKARIESEGGTEVFEKVLIGATGKAAADDNGGQRSGDDNGGRRGCDDNGGRVGDDNPKGDDDGTPDQGRGDA